MHCYDYRTKYKIAQHEIVEFTTYITNLRLTDTWKGMTQQFLSLLKEKLHLLDSLLEESDKLPETTCIVFHQQAVESIPDLQHVSIMDTVWHQKTGSFGTLSYQSHFDLHKSSAYHYGITVNSAINCNRA